MSKKQSIADTVMQEIKTDKLHMRSKLFFILLNAVLIASVAGIMLLSAIFLSLLVSDVRLAQEIRWSAHNADSLRDFIWRFPWMIALLTALAGFSLYKLVRKFSFGYKHGFMVLAGAILLSMIGLGAVLSGTGLPDRLADRGPFRPLSTYTQYAKEKIHLGTVVESEQGRLSLRLEHDTVTVIIDANTQLPVMPIQSGDEIVVFGDLIDGTIQAEIIKPGMSIRHHRIRGGLNFNVIKLPPKA